MFAERPMDSEIVPSTRTRCPVPVRPETSFLRSRLSTRAGRPSFLPWCPVARDGGRTAHRPQSRLTQISPRNARDWKFPKIGAQSPLAWRSEGGKKYWGGSLDHPERDSHPRYSPSARSAQRLRAWVRGLWLERLRPRS
jgi:hypothetical protein